MSAVENVIGAPRRAWWKKRVLAIAWVLASLAAFALVAFALVRWDAAMHPLDVRPAASTETPAIVAHGAAPAVSASVTTSSSSSTKPLSTDAARKRRTRIIRSGGERAAALALSILFATAVLAAFYRVSVSHSRRVVRRVLPGAVLAVVVWLVISWAFGLYVSTLADYAAFYGSLAAVAVLLVWLWLTSLAILVGAELNSQLEGLRD